VQEQCLVHILSVSVVFVTPACNAHARCCVVMCGLSDFLNFFTLSHKWYKKRLLDIKCVFWFSLQRLSEIFLILRRIQQNVITNVHVSLYYSCHVLNWLEFSRQIFEGKKAQMSNFMRSVEREPSSSTWTDGERDMARQITIFRNSANAPKK
jgi:hypothetical protein